MKQIVGIAAVAVLLLAGCAGEPAEPPDTALREAVYACKLTDKSDGVKLGDDDYTLTLDMVGDDQSTGVSYEDTMCVLDKLDMPDSTSAVMGGTRALDGRQTDSWGDITASWSYHPDDGLDVILELEPPKTQ